MLESAAALLTRADGAIKAAGTTDGDAAGPPVSGIFEGEPLPTLETRFTIRTRRRSGILTQSSQSAVLSFRGQGLPLATALYHRSGSRGESRYQHLRTWIHLKGWSGPTDEGGRYPR